MEQRLVRDTVLKLRRRFCLLVISSLILFGQFGCGVELAEFFHALFEERPAASAGFTSVVPARLETVVANARFPVNLVFLPDGTLLYSEKNTGRIRAVTPAGQLLDAPVADFPTAALAQGGCLGLALDPSFAQNGFLYAGHSANSLPFDNAWPRTEYRIVRVTIQNLATVPGSEVRVATIPASTLPGHEGGNLHFGPDGMLYVSIGDRLNNTAPNMEAQDPAALAGKMLRYRPDGTIPADNPFGATFPSFAIGLRNTFDFAFDPISGGLFGGDNGFGGPTEEFNLIEAGANYGWPLAGGFADTPDEQDFAAATPSYRDPLLIIDIAPTGVAFDTMGRYGAAYVNDLFIAEWVPGTIRRIGLSADRRMVDDNEVFASGIPDGMNDIEFSPDGLLYISTGTSVLRIVPD